MTKMKKSIRIVIFCILLLFILSIDSFAYKQGPGVRVCSKSKKLPEGTVYIDLLVPAKSLPEKPSFTELTSMYGKIINLSEESEIVKYNKEGFISFSVYVSDDISYGLYLDQFCVDYFPDGDSDIKKEYEFFRIACLDKNGNILTVSNAASAKNHFNFDFDYFSLSKSGIKAVYIVNPFVTFGIIALAAVPIVIIIVIVKKKKEQNYKG